MKDARPQLIQDIDGARQCSVASMCRDSNAAVAHIAEYHAIGKRDQVTSIHIHAIGATARKLKLFLELLEEDDEPAPKKRRRKA